MGKRLEVPYQRLSKRALKGAIEEFVLREGAESGPSELPQYQKVLRVQWLLEAGKAKIVFDPLTKTHTIIKCDY